MRRIIVRQPATDAVIALTQSFGPSADSDSNGIPLPLPLETLRVIGATVCDILLPHDIGALMNVAVSTANNGSLGPVVHL